MKIFCLGILLSFSAFAENSKLIPVFMDAAQIYTSKDESVRNAMVLDPKTRAVLNVLEEKKIDPAILQKYTQDKMRSSWKLPQDDQFDRWSYQPALKVEDVPEVALNAVKFDVVKSSEWLKDDIYVYFFVTDGVIPTGKVSSIYKEVASGQSFFFNEIDRAIFPLQGISGKRPQNHLIVDYGVIESDGDDIKELQKLSSIIIDIAIAVYTSYDPENSQIIVKLRKEIKALADMLLSMNSDDRLVTSSFGFKNSELNSYFGDETYIGFIKNHKSTSGKRWEYDLHFRLLKN